MEEEEEEKCPAGLPGWMATFSDLMTLLLTFFVLLLSMANMDPIKAQAGSKSVKDALAGVSLFANVTVAGTPASPQVLIPSPLYETEMTKKRIPVEDNKKDIEKNSESQDDQDNEKNDKQKEQEAKQSRLEGQKKDAIAMAQEKEINDITRNVQMTFKDDIAKGAIAFKSENQRIVIEYPAEDSFKSGSAELTDKMKRASQKLAFMLKDKSVQISIAGYTDSIPINTSRFRSNWDLSVMRASSVANAMLKYVAFRPEQIEVKGYGEGHPKASNSTAEGRMQNRRLEIVIEPDEDLDQVLPGNFIDGNGDLNRDSLMRIIKSNSRSDSINSQKIIQKLRQKNKQ